jgi:hypothetical protein
MTGGWVTFHLGNTVRPPHNKSYDKIYMLLLQPEAILGYMVTLSQKKKKKKKRFALGPSINCKQPCEFLLQTHTAQGFLLICCAAAPAQMVTITHHLQELKPSRRREAGILLFSQVFQSTFFLSSASCTVCTSFSPSLSTSLGDHFYPFKLMSPRAFASAVTPGRVTPPRVCLYIEPSSDHCKQPITLHHSIPRAFLSVS